MNELTDEVTHKNPNKITKKQLEFANEYLRNNGHSKQAIRTLYPEKTEKEVKIFAEKFMLEPAVRQFLVEYKKNMEKVTEITFLAKVDKLWEIVKEAHQDKKYTPAIAGIAELNKMQGHHAPQVNINGDTTAEEMAALAAKYKREY